MWNASGLHGADRRNSVRDAILFANADIVCLQETKVVALSRRRFLSVFGSSYDKYVMFFFWNKYSEGSPHCGRYIYKNIRKNPAVQSSCTETWETLEAEKKTSCTKRGCPGRTAWKKREICKLGDGLAEERGSSSLKRRWKWPEDEVVPLIPNFPGGDDEELHEERVLRPSFGWDYHLVKVFKGCPLNSNLLPADSRKWAGEKKV